MKVKCFQVELATYTSVNIILIMRFTICTLYSLDQVKGHTQARRVLNKRKLLNFQFIYIRYIMKKATYAKAVAILRSPRWSPVYWIQVTGLIAVSPVVVEVSLEARAFLRRYVHPVAIVIPIAVSILFLTSDENFTATTNN